MDKSPDAPELESIERLLERFERRLRIQRAVSGAVEGACLGLMIGGVAIAAMRTGWAESSLWWLWIAAAVLITIGGALFRALQPVDSVAAAQRLDQSHDLHDRLSTAISLAQRGDLSDEDDAFVRAQLQDALRYADAVDPRHAAPWRRPPDTLLLVMVGMAVLTVGIIPINDHEEPLPEGFEVEHAPVFDDATLAMERNRLEEFRRQLEDVPDERAEALADEIEALLEAVENREISDREFAERVDELLEDQFAADVAEQRELATMSDALAEAAQQTADEHADALEKHPELEDTMDALQDGDFQGASEALSDLAERIEEEELSDEESSRLADVLERFADHLDGHEERLQDLFEEHRDSFEDLADQFEGGDFDGDDQLLDDARDAMEEAADRREEFADSGAQRQLDRLSRELQESAEQLREDADRPPEQPPSDAEADQPSADTADDETPEGDESAPPEVADEQHPEQRPPDQRPDDQQDSDEPDYRNQIGRQLDDASRELEEMERQRQRQQQRQRGREQLEDMRESMARDGDGEDDRRGEQMEDFMDRAGGGEDPGDEAREMPGEPDGAHGDADDGGDQGEGEDVTAGDTTGEGGPGEGEEHDDEDLEFGHQREELRGTESDEGRTHSEIIQTASEEGFATTEYEDVYAEYEDIAEQVMDREQVPDGYRYYIERYFQMIRPQR